MSYTSCRRSGMDLHYERAVALAASAGLLVLLKNSTYFLQVLPTGWSGLMKRRIQRGGGAICRINCQWPRNYKWDDSRSAGLSEGHLRRAMRQPVCESAGLRSLGQTYQRIRVGENNIAICRHRR